MGFWKRLLLGYLSQVHVCNHQSYVADILSLKLIAGVEANTLACFLLAFWQESHILKPFFLVSSKELVVVVEALVVVVNSYYRQ